MLGGLCCDGGVDYECWITVCYEGIIGAALTWSDGGGATVNGDVLCTV